MTRPLIIIPTYNERDNLRTLLPTLWNIVPGCHVLIVDDGSPDGTAALVRALARARRGRLHLIERPGKMGLGTAYVEGYRFAMAAGRYGAVVQMDADGSSDPRELPGMLAGLTRADVVLASRYLDGVRVLNWPRSRVVLSLLANEYARIVAGFRCSDLTNAFMAMRIGVARRIAATPFRTAHHAFVHELKFRMEHMGIRIAESRALFANRERGESTVSRWVLLEALTAILRLGVARGWLAVKRLVGWCGPRSRYVGVAPART